MLLKFCASERQSQHYVFSMTRRLEMAQKLEDCGVIVQKLRPSTLSSVKSVLKNRSNQILIHGWMYHGSLLAWAVQKLICSNGVLIWHVRQSLGNYASLKPFSRFLLSLNSLCSSQVQLILFNSELALKDHLDFGYSSENSHCWRNGFLTKEFFQDLRSREGIRDRLQIEASQSVFIFVGRDHPDKDPDNLFKAVSRLLSKRKDVHLILVGYGFSENHLAENFASFRLPKAQIHFVGPQSDVRPWLSAADFFVLPSKAESFPNVIGEAVLCGLLPISTDVGEVRSLIQDNQLICPPSQPRALRDKMLWALTLSCEERAKMVSRLQEDFKNRYSMEACLKEFRSLLSRRIKLSEKEG